ncbi:MULTISPECIES: hypothetical protein [unclassified Streptomyces]|uniref:hypothetical protein n=1 Tax=unclassified Streptomyces TaxID=2593676 RepID=UPI0035D8C70B
MPVPDARVELQIGGTWTDVTQHVVQSAGIQLEYGRSDEGRPVDPGSGSLTLLSPGGLYSNRNPSSPYYGLLPRNTPVRVSATAGETFLRINDSVNDRASTPHHASLTVTDLDVRFDARLDDWAPTDTTLIMGKWVAPPGRSWYLYLGNGRDITLRWSTDGTAYVQKTSMRLPVGSGRRLALRVTLDTDNGSGGHTVTFWTAPTIAGPWKVHGTPMVTAGTTAIAPTTSDLQVGGLAGLIFPAPVGEIYAAELRSGIDGPVVAAPRFDQQAVGTPSFADAAGRTWTTQDQAVISDRRTRVVHAVPTWPTTWHRSGHDVRAPIETAGVLRRLGQGRKGLESTLRRRVPNYAPLAYWPCEDSQGATTAANPIPGGQPLSVSGWQFGEDGTLTGSSPLPVIAPGGTMRGRVPAPSAPSSTWAVCMLYRVEGGAPATHQEMLSWTTTGTIRRWRVQAGPISTVVLGYNVDGAMVLFDTHATGGWLFSGAWWRLELVAQQSGSSVTYELRWTQVDGGAAVFTGSVAGTLGAVDQVDTRVGLNLPGIRVGHVAVFPAASVTTAYHSADHGYTREPAADRIRRLGREETKALPMGSWQGDSTRTSERMGPQRPGALLDVLQEAADADGGILMEDSRRVGLTYRDRTSLENQTPVVIPYAALTTPFAPEEGDTRLRNDITVQRTGGSSARAVREDGPLSVDAVGQYDEAMPVSLAKDEQAAQIAWWRLHLGTWDEARYPSVRIMLHKHPELIPTVSTLQIGDRIQITDTPPWMPPGPIDLIVQRIREDIRTHTWDVVLACSPAGPWRIGVLDDPILGRIDTDGCTLGAAVAASDTNLLLVSGPGAPWITTESHPGDFPVDLQVGGEVVRATAIRGIAADAFGRTEAAGWGTADSGQPWTRSGGMAAEYSVAGGVGVHAATVRGSLRATTMPVPLADIDLRTDVSLAAVPAGGQVEVHLMTRRVGSGDFYSARFYVAAGGAITLSLRRVVGGTDTELASYATGLTLTAGAWYRLRLSVQGTSLAAKVWPRTGAEPAPWQVAAADASLTLPGVIGMRTVVGSSTTNPLPLSIFFDTVVSTPQQATVVRSVNGIVKGHAADAAVSLAYPVYLAL